MTGVDPWPRPTTAWACARGRTSRASRAVLSPSVRRALSCGCWGDRRTTDDRTWQLPPRPAPRAGASSWGSPWPGWGPDPAGATGGGAGDPPGRERSVTATGRRVGRNPGNRRPPPLVPQGRGPAPILPQSVPPDRVRRVIRFAEFTGSHVAARAPTNSGVTTAVDAGLR